MKGKGRGEGDEGWEKDSGESGRRGRKDWKEKKREERDRKREEWKDIYNVNNFDIKKIIIIKIHSLSWIFIQNHLIPSNKIKHSLIMQLLK